MVVGNSDGSNAYTTRSLTLSSYATGSSLQYQADDLVVLNAFGWTSDPTNSNTSLSMSGSGWTEIGSQQVNHMNNGDYRIRMRSWYKVLTSSDIDVSITVTAGNAFINGGGYVNQWGFGFLRFRSTTLAPLVLTSSQAGYDNVGIGVSPGYGPAVTVVEPSSVVVSMMTAVSSVYANTLVSGYENGYTYDGRNSTDVSISVNADVGIAHQDFYSTGSSAPMCGWHMVGYSTGFCSKTIAVYETAVVLPSIPRSWGPGPTGWPIKAGSGPSA